MTKITEINLNSTLQRKQFVDFSFSITKKFPNWRPGLRLFTEDKINPGKNPFLKRYALRLFKVENSQGKTIAQGGFVEAGYFPEMPQTGLLVFPDFLEDYPSFSFLMNFLVNEVAQEGCRELLGPFNPNIHYDVGVQFSHFEEVNASFMGYQPPYYHEFYEKYGFNKQADFYSWHLKQSVFLPTDAILRAEQKVLNQTALHIRPISLKKYSDELKIFHDLYSRSFADHWAFVPPEYDEFKFIAGDLKYILKEEMALVAEWNGKPVGFVLGIPDLFSAINKKYNGKMNFISIASLLFRIKKIKQTRVMIAGLLPEYRFTGAHVPLFLQIARNIFNLGYTGGQIAWVMDDNLAMNKILKQMGAEKKQGYRVYTLQIVN